MIDISTRPRCKVELKRIDSIDTHRMASYQMNQSIYDNALQLRFATFSKSNIQTIKQSLNHLKSLTQLSNDGKKSVANHITYPKVPLSQPVHILLIKSTRQACDLSLDQCYHTDSYNKSAFSPCLRTRPINNQDHFKSRCSTLLKSANEIMFDKAAVDHSFHNLTSKLAFV